MPFQPARAPSALPAVNLLTKEEDARNQKDADYKWLVSDIGALEQLRKQKSLSLNLADRRAERTQQDAERLARENARRVAQGKAPLKALDEPDTEEGAPVPTASKEKGPDILLDQAAQIMADVVVATAPAPAPTVVAKDAAAHAKAH